MLIDHDEATAHVWVLPVTATLDPDEEAACLAVLDADERARLDGLTLPSVRGEYLRARALVRSALTWYTGHDVRSWRFAANAWGRPFVAGEPGVFFNLSHTRGMLSVVLAREPEVGIDVEWIARPSQTVSVAHRYFAPAELEALSALDPAAQRDAFFDFWTLKEAYIKARGRGLAIPLAQFAFLRGDPITVRFDPRLGDNADDWDFVRFDPAAGHRVALALRRASGRARPWRLHRAVHPRVDLAAKDP